MATTRLMPLHIGKGQTAGDAIKRALGYIKDPAKTENGILVTNYGNEVVVLGSVSAGNHGFSVSGGLLSGYVTSFP